MSGIEVAGLAFGIVPIFVAATGVYKKINDRLETLRHPERVAKRLSIKFRISRTRIQNVFQRLFKPVLEESDPWRYMQETGLSSKQRSDIAAHIEQSLGTDSAVLLSDILQEISTIMKDVTLSLANIESLVSANTAESFLLPSLDSTTSPQSIRKSPKEILDIFLHESKYAKQLEELRTWVEQLEHLIPTKGETPTQGRPELRHILPLPSSITAINDASRELWMGLDKTWRCLNETHGNHNAAIWFDAELDMDDVVHMDVSISCQPRQPKIIPVNRHEATGSTEDRVWLHIKSHSSTHMDNERSSPKRARNSTTVQLDASHSAAQQGPYTQSNPQSNSATTVVQHRLFEPVLSGNANLNKLPSVCCHLFAVNFSRPLQGSNCCHGGIGTTRGYLGTGTGYTHVIHHSKPGRVLNQNPPMRAVCSQPVTEYLGRMTRIQQLKTAYEVTMGLLRYNHTPWLQEDWSLSDISYFDSSSFDQHTFHVTKRLPSKNTLSHDVLTPGPMSVNPPSQELRRLLGIRNAPLACLGQALVEIAHGKPLKDLRLPKDPSDAVTARRLANGVHAILGMEYCRIVRKCLYADFVVDCSDLKDGRLRTAVYNEVALGLEVLVKDREQLISSMP